MNQIFHQNVNGIELDQESVKWQVFMVMKVNHSVLYWMGIS
jgi:hypothetical protein